MYSSVKYEVDTVINLTTYLLQKTINTNKIQFPAFFYLYRERAIFGIEERKIKIWDERILKYTFPRKSWKLKNY